MNTLIESLNHWGNRATDFAWPLLWQSSLLIGALLLLDALLRRRGRAVLRYALWLLVLLKLLLPPSLALPTGLGYWLGTSHATPPPPPAPRAVSVITLSGTVPALRASSLVAPTPPKLSRPSELLLVWFAGSAILLGFLVRRSWQAARLLRQAQPANEELQSLLDNCRRQLELRHTVRLKLSASAVSPAICGLWRPAMLLPGELAQRLTPDQLRAVLLHELVHLQRHDVWVNCLQALLQVVYWWHPLVWLANARIRRVREEAVDEAVMVALGPQAETYPATLLEVAKLAFARPLTALGLVGIFESKGALQQRIRRLLDRPASHSAKLNFAGILSVAACGALLLPMARGHRAEAPAASAPPGAANSTAANVLVECRFLDIDEDVLRSLTAGLPDLIGTNGHRAWVIPPAQVTNRLDALTGLPGVRLVSAPRLTLVNGMTGQISDSHADSLNGRNVNLRSTCEVTPRLRGTDVDLTLKASITELAEVNGTGPPVLATQAPGDASCEVADVRVSVPDHGGLIVHNLGASTSEGRHLLLIVKPVILREDGETPAATNRFSSPTAVMIYAKPEPLWVVEVSAKEPFYSRDGQPTTLAELSQALARDVAAGRSAVLQIRAANDVPLGSLMKVLDAAQAAGVKQISFRGRPIKETQRSPAAAASRPIALETRIFRVDPATFIKDLITRIGSPLAASAGDDPSKASFGADGGALDPRHVQVPFGGDESRGELPGVTRTNASQPTTDAFRAFIEATGISLSPPNQLFYTYGKGVLMVRASPRELDTIETALDLVNRAPQQLIIEAKFIKAPEAFVKGITQGTVVSSVDATNQMRILSDSQTRAFIQELEEAPGVDLLSAPKVTTLSGRQTQIQVVDIQTILTGIDPAALAEPGRPAKEVTNASPFLSQQVPLGPTLDLIPQVADDGFTLDLTALANITEFLGYDKPTNTVPVYVNGAKQDVEPPLPRMRNRPASGRASLYDGQSLLLIGPATAVTYQFADKVPVLGDLPLVGRLFRSQGTSTVSKQLVIIITPTLIDPAGNPIHTPDNLPYDPNSVPPQPK